LKIRERRGIRKNFHPKNGIGKTERKKQKEKAPCGPSNSRSWEEKHQGKKGATVGGIKREGVQKSTNEWRKLSVKKRGIRKPLENGQREWILRRAASDFSCKTKRNEPNAVTSPTTKGGKREKKVLGQAT